MSLLCAAIYVLLVFRDNTDPWYWHLPFMQCFYALNSGMLDDNHMSPGASLLLEMQLFELPPLPQNCLISIASCLLLKQPWEIENADDCFILPQVWKWCLVLLHKCREMIYRYTSQEKWSNVRLKSWKLIKRISKSTSGTNEGHKTIAHYGAQLYQWPGEAHESQQTDCAQCLYILYIYNILYMYMV